MSWRDSPLGERVRYHAARAAAWARRARPAALAVRATVFATGFVALVLVAPPPVGPVRAAVVAAVVALPGAVRPGGSWVTGLELVVVGAVSLAVWLGEPPGLVTVAGLAVLLYLHHTVAALGATLRADTLVPASVLLHWAGRAAAVLAGGAVVGIVVVSVPDRMPGWPAAALTVLAAAAALVVTGTIAYLGRSRRQAGGPVDDR